jgi:hypothetical protein
VIAPGGNLKVDRHGRVTVFLRHRTAVIAAGGLKDLRGCVLSFDSSPIGGDRRLSAVKK